MTGAQTSLLPETPAEEREGETDTAERGDDPTPRGVIRAALDAVPFVESKHPVTGLRSLGMFDDCGLAPSFQFDIEDRPLRVLDVCAGYGAWASEMRRRAQRQGWPVHITGVEIHEPRREFLRRWCDLVRVEDWRSSLDAAEYAVDDQGFDLVIGNPDFKLLLRDAAANFVPVDQTMVAVLLRHAPAVLLMHTQQAFLKSEAGRACWRAYPPAATWLVPGGVKFRGAKNGADSRCYQVTLWLRGHTGPCSTYLLDDLAAAERSWTVPPGTERPSPCEACGGSGDAGNAEWVEWSDAGMNGDAPGACSACDGSRLDPHGDLPTAPGWRHA